MTAAGMDNVLNLRKWPEVNVLHLLWSEDVYSSANTA